MERHNFTVSSLAIGKGASLVVNDEAEFIDSEWHTILRESGAEEAS